MPGRCDESSPFSLGPVSNLIIVGHHGAAIAETTEQLSRIKAEYTRFAKRAGEFTVKL